MLYQKEIPIRSDCDVLVCGGGPAGFPAALAAARLGAKTAIAEKNNQLGGVMTTGRNNDVALFNAGARPVIRGIGWGFVARLARMGHAEIPLFASGIPHPQQGVRVNIPAAAALMDQMCEEDRVQVHYFATLVDVVRKDRSWLAVFASKAGLWAISARWIVDCTGDGDACALAGADYEIGGEEGELQPGTLGFYLHYDRTVKLDFEALHRQYYKSLDEGELQPGDVWASGATILDALKNGGVNVGHVPVNRDYEERRGEIERMGRRSLLRLQQWFDRYLPQAAVEILAAAPEVAMRESRRIVCNHRVTWEEYVAGVTHPEDVCYSYYPIDLHIHDEQNQKTLHNIFLDEEHVPGIPYGALVPQNVPNMLVAGRAIGGDRLAQSAYRIKATCMATGQAAGTAAALAVRHGEAEIPLLRDTLAAAGAIVPGK